MRGALSIAILLVLAGTLIASGMAKFRRPDDLAGWAALGVPRILRREWLRRLHPAGELALGIAVASLGGWLGVLASLATVILMLGYTALITRTFARHDDTSCACFGTRRRVTGVTIARNVWLTILAVASVAGASVTPLLGGALAEGISQWSWLVVLAITAVTTAFVLWPDAAIKPDGDLQEAADFQQGRDGSDYIRTRIPAVPVTQADGTVVNLRALAARKPILLLAVSSTCGRCLPVIEGRGRFRALVPEVDVRLLLTDAAEVGALTELEEPQSLHDVNEFVRGSISDWATPTAVLLGGDGLLAGGPVTGADAIAAFVDDIYESLHGERPLYESSRA